MITIFTPVYNRAYIIENLYESLIRQTCKEFEWIIVDDGSTDGLQSLVTQWNEQEYRGFPIIYLHQENGGKHKACNHAVREAKGEAFFFVDSDDILSDDAIEKVCLWWKEIAGDDRFAGVSGLRAYLNTARTVCGRISEGKYIDVSNLEREKYGVQFDLAEIYKTKYLKKYPFPEFEGENFLTEAVVWDKMAYEGLIKRIHQEVIYYSEYLEDGLTVNSEQKFRSNPKGWGLYLSQSNLYHKWSERERFENYFYYYCCEQRRLSDEEIAGSLSISISDLSRIQEQRERCVANTIEKIGTKIAVYGAGNIGHMIIAVYAGTPVTVEYVLDRKEANVGIRQVNMETEGLPDVDAILITPKHYQEEIYTFLTEKTAIRLLKHNEWWAICQ